MLGIRFFASLRMTDVTTAALKRLWRTIRAFSFLGQVGMDPYQGEGFRDVGGVAAQGSGDVGAASPAHPGAGQVAKSRHHLGSVAGPYVGAVLVKGGVPYQCTRFSMSQCFLRTRSSRFAPPAAGDTLATA